MYPGLLGLERTRRVAIIKSTIIFSEIDTYYTHDVCLLTVEGGK